MSSTDRMPRVQHTRIVGTRAWRWKRTQDALIHAIVYLETLETKLPLAEENQRQGVLKQGREALGPYYVASKERT